MAVKFTCNESFFKHIDNEEKSYWLGFILADGYINERTGQDRLKITLSAKDYEHLLLFKKCIRFTGPVILSCKKSGPFKGYQTATISITSQQLVDDLKSHNCTPRKSLTLSFPRNIPNPLVHHLIRGYFDGDGSVFISNEKHWRSGACFDVIHFRFTGTQPFLCKVQEYVGIKGHLIRPRNDKTFELSYKRRKKALTFYHFLYKNSTIFLTRKKEVFESQHYTFFRNQYGTFKKPINGNKYRIAYGCNGS